MSAADNRRTHPGHDWFDVEVIIRRVADGEVRVCRDAAIRDGWRFQWSDGNYGCDCNRYLFFERADTRTTDPIEDERPCSETAYVVEKITDAETGEVLIEGDPRT